MTRIEDANAANGITMSHIPVLLRESINVLDLAPGEFAIDGTIGGGGHAREILKKISPGGTLLGIDWDSEAIKKLSSRLSSLSSHLVFTQGNYADLPEIVRAHTLKKADAIFLDLGSSSDQLEGSGRGFSFQKDEPLLMTYDDGRMPAWKILKNISEAELAKIIKELGGEKYAKRIAKAIKNSGKVSPIRTSGELAKIVRETLPKNYENGRIDPATRTFQALRIYANDELGNLKKVLAAIPKIVSPGGRVAIITFQSLEDDMVKDAFWHMVQEKTAQLIVKSPIVASVQELKANIRSRSARLRAIRIL